MEKKAVMISSGSTFMVNAIVNNLKGAEYEVEQMGPSIKELNKLSPESRIVLFYLGPFVDSIPEVLVYLKDVCLEQEKWLCLIGDHEEFKSVEREIPSEIITKKFERPLDIKALIASLDQLSDQDASIAQRKNILLVDDDSSFLKIVKGWLSDRYRVVIVNSGMQAITYLANNKPDLILLDYEMPVTSGPQVMEMIKSEPSTDSIPIIFLTGKSDKESVMKVLALKPDGYLLKSMDRQSIVAEVDKFFEKQKIKKII
ncbi:MAG: response regulator [Lachnospiraceae bacterium]|nr:response regulator [Lachnospiraceae bacterium]